MSLKPSTPKGTRDFSSKVLSKRNYLKNILQKAFESFAFQPIETPSFERLSTLMGKYGDEGDRLIFKILNSGDKLKKADIDSFKNNSLKQFSNSLSEKALRYDLTVPFARYVANNQNDLIFPFRRYQIQNVWRADRPQHGRFQEFCQCDADIVGNKSLLQEVEMISLYDRVFFDLKLKGTTVKINHRKILEGIVSLIGNEKKLIDFTVAVDKTDKIGLEGVEDELLLKGFSYDSIKKIKPILNLKGGFKKMLFELESLFSNTPVGLEGVNELRFIFNKLNSIGLKSTILSLDLTLARGLNYYTGTIVEVDGPSNINMGSIGGGGRYDDLTSSFGMKDVSGIGISFGFDRIYLVLEQLNLFPIDIEKKTQILFLNSGSNSVDVALSSLSKLREIGLICELYPSEIKMSKQLNYANKKDVSYVVILGDDEFKNKTFTLKNMISGDQNEYPLIDRMKILEKLF